MTSSTDQPRTFLCLVLNDAARLALRRMHECIRQREIRLSFAGTDEAHVTLVFLGNTPSELAEMMPARMDEVAAGVPPFCLSVGGAGFFGQPHTPKVAWVGVKASPVLMELQARLALAMEAMGHPQEKRGFHPHVTVARIRSRLPPAALTSIRACINNTSFDEIPVDRVLFMKNRLKGAGPRYATIHQSMLKGKTDHG